MFTLVLLVTVFFYFSSLKKYWTIAPKILQKHLSLRYDPLTYWNAQPQSLKKKKSPLQATNTASIIIYFIQNLYLLPFLKSNKHIFFPITEKHAKVQSKKCKSTLYFMTTKLCHICCSAWQNLHWTCWEREENIYALFFWDENGIEVISSSPAPSLMVPLATLQQHLAAFCRKLIGASSPRLTESSPAAHNKGK